MAHAPSATSRLTRRTFLAAAGALGAGAAIACAPATTAPQGRAKTPVRGGNLIIGAAADPLSLDPLASGDSASNNAMAYMYEGLLRFDNDLKVVPELATSWEGKGREYTFKLRRGVKFHDGTPFNAAAAKAHFDRAIGPEKPFASRDWVPWLESTQVIDDFTLKMTTKTPYAFFGELVAGPSGKIPSPTAVAKFGKDFLRNPVGTGPFRFGEWSRDVQFVVVRNDDYWGEKAMLDKVTTRPFPDANARLVALEAGDLHYVGSLSVDQRDRAVKNESLAVREFTGLGVSFIGMNVLKKPFDDVRVRQAINHAIDMDSVVKNIYGGAAESVKGPIPRSVVGWSQTPGFPYDPAKAKQLLAAAGLANGFSATYLSSDNYTKDKELAQFIQQQLKEVGITLTLQQKEWAAYLQDLRMPPSNSPVQIWRDSRGGRTAPDYWLTVYGCKAHRPAGGNTNGSCDASLDDLANQAVAETDETKRNGIMKTLQDRAWSLAFSVWGVTPKILNAHSKKLNEPVFNIQGQFSVSTKTWLDQ
ncbi:MAG: hypothetical protein FJ034_04245 [Chloroflexi bacterium]|nr:hypothetical protein [Chloroflexota bacterium]